MAISMTMTMTMMMMTTNMMILMTNMMDLLDDTFHCFQVADNSWLVQSVDQCPVLPEIVEGGLNYLMSQLKIQHDPKCFGQDLKVPI